MVTIDDLLKKWSRIIILYPIYNGISEKLEQKWPLIKDVRENPNKYSAQYVSQRGLCGNPSDEQIIELVTYLEGKHVEIMVKIYRKFPNNWEYEKKDFEGHLLASLFDCPFIIDENVYKLSENFI